jgi:hypothetical protein
VTNKKKNIYLFFLLPIFLYGIYCSLIIGKSWDAFFFINLGKERLAYLFSLGLKDQSEIFISEVYPGIYNTLSAFILQLFPKQFELNIFHLTNFSISTLVAVGTYKLTKKLFNKQIGICAFIIFILLPVFFGHMSINDRDTITAFSNIWISFYVLQYIKLNKDKKKKYIFILGFLLALGLGVRFAFIATLLPICLYFIYLIYKLRKKIKIKEIIYDVIKILLISSVIIIVFWVPTHENIISKIPQLLKKSFDTGFGYPFIFLNGEVFESANYPKNYIFKNLFFKTPEYILILYVLFIGLIFKIYKNFLNEINGFRIKVIFVLFNLFLPSILILFSPYSLYDGLRLFIYILPYFSILPAIVCFYLYKNISELLNKSLLILTLFFKIYYIYIFLTLTPYHYTYLNLFAGKFSKTNEKFENDYWGTSLRELSKKIKNNQLLKSKGFLKVSICGVGKGSVNYYLNKVQNLNYKIVGSDKKSDFIIIVNRVLWDYDNVNNKNIKTCFDKYRGKSIEEVKRNGLVLSAIKQVN